MYDEQRQWDFRPDIDIVLPARLRRDPFDREGEDIAAELQRRRQHPRERQEQTMVTIITVK